MTKKNRRPPSEKQRKPKLLPPTAPAPAPAPAPGPGPAPAPAPAPAPLSYIAVASKAAAPTSVRPYPPSSFSANPIPHPPSSFSANPRAHPPSFFSANPRAHLPSLWTTGASASSSANQPSLWTTSPSEWPSFAPTSRVHTPSSWTTSSSASSSTGATPRAQMPLSRTSGASASSSTAATPRVHMPSPWSTGPSASSSTAATRAYHPQSHTAWTTGASASSSTAATRASHTAGPLSYKAVMSHTPQAHPMSFSTTSIGVKAHAPERGQWQEPSRSFAAQETYRDVGDMTKTFDPTEKSDQEVGKFLIHSGFPFLSEGDTLAYKANYERKMQYWGTSDDKQSALSKMLDEWAVYIQRKYMKQLCSFTYLSEAESFLEQYAKRSPKNQAMVGVTGNFVGDENLDNSPKQGGLIPGTIWKRY